MSKRTFYISYKNISKLKYNCNNYSPPKHQNYKKLLFNAIVIANPGYQAFTTGGSSIFLIL